MKCIIFFVSFTGNTKLAAEHVKRGIEASGHSCELMEMRNVSSELTAERLQGFDLMGFMSPVFGWREPSIWRKFLARFPRLESQPAFIGVTAGGNPGNYFYRVEKQLAKSGIYTIATIFVVAPSSYIPWNKNASSFDPQELARAGDFGAKLFTNFDEIVVQKTTPPPEQSFNIGGAILGTGAGHDFKLRAVISLII